MIHSRGLDVNLEMVRQRSIFYCQRGKIICTENIHFCRPSQQNSVHTLDISPLDHVGGCSIMFSTWSLVWKACIQFLTPKSWYSRLLLGATRRARQSSRAAPGHHKRLAVPERRGRPGTTSTRPQRWSGHTAACKVLGLQFQSSDQKEAVLHKRFEATALSNYCLGVSVSGGKKFIRCFYHRLIKTVLVCSMRIIHGELSWCFC